MSKRYITIVLAIVLVCSIAGIGTMAWFTSSAASTANTFSTGTLRIGDLNEATGRYEFAKLEFDNIEPGEKVIKTTVIKNSGSLPVKLYRLNASNLKHYNYQAMDDYVDLKVVMKYEDEAGVIQLEDVYWGKLRQIMDNRSPSNNGRWDENGGFFDPIFPIAPGKQVEMIVSAKLDEDAQNNLMGKSVTCDLNVYATQVEAPEQGYPDDIVYDLGTSIGNYNEGSAPNNPVLRKFSVMGVNNSANGTIDFTFDWDEANPDFRVYVYIKHETGSWNRGTEPDEWEDMGYGWIDEKLALGISSENVGPYGDWTDWADLNNFEMDWTTGTLSIDRNAFPADWKGFEVKFSAYYGNEAAQTIIPYQYWSLNRTE